MQDLSRLSDDELRALYAQANGGPAPVTAPSTPIIVRRANPVANAREQTQLEIERARLQAQQADNANAELERARLEAQVALAQAQANNANNGGPQRFMSDKLAGEVDTQVQTYLNMRRAAQNFQNDFGGNTITGRAENWLQGAFSSFGTPGQRDWWADFNSTDNVIRNSLFGASLTEGEKAAYEATTINPSMDPREISSNLNRRAEILRNALSRRVNVLEAGNYNPQQIDAALGDALPDIRQPQQGRASEVNMNAQNRESLGPVGEGTTYRTVPELSGMANEIAQRIARGDTRDSILTYYHGRMASAGIPPVPGQIDFINNVYNAHQRQPNRDVASISSGWGNLERQENPPAQTIGDNIRAGIGQLAASPMGSYAINMANGISAGNLGNFANMTGTTGANANDIIDMSRQENPIASFLGDTVGSTLTVASGEGLAGAAASRLPGMAGRAAGLLTKGGGLGVDALYGAARGASEAAPGNELGGALWGTVGGVGGNLAGRGAVNVAGRATRGIVDPSVRYLADRGIVLSPGQMLGNQSVLGRFSNALESAPVIGGMFGARRADSLADFNRVALNDAVAPVGGRVTDIGPPGINQAQNVVSDAYDRTFANANVYPDPQFMTDATAALSAGRGVVDMGQKFGQLMDSQVGPLFNSPSGTLGGPQLQAALSRTRGIGASLRATGDPVAPLVGDAADQFGNALTDLVERQAPGTIPQLRAANEAYGNLQTLQNAALNARNQVGPDGAIGMFTPGQLRASATNNTVRYGGRNAAARGDIPFEELTRHAQTIIPNTLPNSGTADRLAALALPTVLGGSAIGLETFTDNPIATSGLGALALLSTRRGARIAQRGLLGSARRQRLGNAILRNQDVGGLLGAAMAIPALTTSGQ